MRLTGRVPILDRLLILEHRPQDTSSNSQSQLRDVYLVTLFRLCVADEAVLGGK